MLDDNLFWLINWYDCQCDGDWEHQFGIRIETLDNPGWSIRLSIQETELQDKEFQNINIERTEKDWIFCRVSNGFFEGNCGTFNLPEVLQIFRDWAESY
jgi:hypothetical protein